MEIKAPIDTLRLLPASVVTQDASKLSELEKFHKREWDLASSDFWYWAKFVKTEDEDAGTVRDFPNFEYLKELDYEIEHNQKVIILKSRRLMISWLGMLRQLHSAMFAGTFATDSQEAYRGGVMSVGETEAKYLIERASKVWHRLPDWMKDRNQIHKDNDLLLTFEFGGTVQAFPLKREGPQTFGFTRVFFDEMALQEAARSVWMGMMPTLGARGKLLAVSTPNGKSNLFADVWFNKNDSYNGILRKKLHWSANPEHDQEWYKATTGAMDKQMIARMFELSFAVYAGMPVWPEFDRMVHAVNQTYIIPGRPVFVGWDFGYHFPFASFWQFNTLSQYVGLREFAGFDIGFDTFCKNVKEFANTFFDPRKNPSIHFIDPAGFQRYHSRSASGAVSDVHEIKNIWGVDAQIRPGAIDVGTRSNEGTRLKEVRKLWTLRSDGRPGVVMDERMETFIEGCLGGYCYPEKNTSSEEPEKNESSHGQDSFQYVVTGHNRMMGTSEPKRAKQQPVHRVGHRTGV